MSGIQIGGAATCRTGVVGPSEGIIGADRVEGHWVGFETFRGPLEPFSRVELECLLRGPTAGQADVASRVTEESVVLLDLDVLGKSV